VFSADNDQPTRCQGAAKASVTTFLRDNSTTGVCYFMIFYANWETRNVTMRNGERITGVQPGDSFCGEFHQMPSSPICDR
jgi:hypothetical protein